MQYREKGFDGAAEGRVQGSFGFVMPSLREGMTTLRMTKFCGWCGINIRGRS